MDLWGEFTIKVEQALWVQGQPGLHPEFWASQDYIGIYIQKKAEDAGGIHNIWYNYAPLPFTKFPQQNVLSQDVNVYRSQQQGWGK